MRLFSIKGKRVSSSYYHIFDKFNRRTKYEFLAFMNFIGAQHAMWRGYSHYVVRYLLNSTKSLLRTGKIDFPVSFDLMNYQEAYYCSFFDQTDTLNAIENVKLGSSDEFQAKAEELSKTIEAFGEPDKSAALKKSIVMTASKLPSGGARQHSVVSVFTSRYIQGPYFLLSDGHTKISVQDAIMWTNVNPFCPLQTGEKINPY